MLNPEFIIEKTPVAWLARFKALDPLAAAIQPTIRRARDANPRVKSALAGTWIGHSLHVMLTDVPVGAFTTHAALDLAELAGLQEMSRASDLTLGLGIASAYGAVVTGYADWADTQDQPRRVGMAHALLNGTALLAYQTSFILRRTNRRRLGMAISLVGYGILTAAAYLGGELSTGMQLGVRHTANPVAPPDDFVDVAALDDVPNEGWLRVEAAGIPILLSRNADGVHAVGAVCSHRGAPLEEGTREGDCVRCPWHGARFSLNDGTVREGPATFGLPQYDARVTGDRIAIRAIG